MIQDVEWVVNSSEVCVSIPSSSSLHISASGKILNPKLLLMASLGLFECVYVFLLSEQGFCMEVPEISI